MKGVRVDPETSAEGGIKSSDRHSREQRSWVLGSGTLRNCAVSRLELDRKPVAFLTRVSTCIMPRPGLWEDQQFHVCRVQGGVWGAQLSTVRNAAAATSPCWVVR